MILCRRDGFWYIGQRGQAHLKGVSLRIGRNMPGGDGFRPSRSGWLRSAPFPSPDGITFYPELRYRGARVYVEWWHPASTEPIVRVRMMDWDAQACGLSIEAMAAEGWATERPGDGITKYLHVDEIEKIEGPAPDGVF